MEPQVAAHPPTTRRPTRVGAVLSTHPHDGGGHQYATTVLGSLGQLTDGPDLSLLVTGEAEPDPDVAACFGPALRFGEAVEVAAAGPGAPGALGALARRVVGEGRLRDALRGARRRLRRPERLDPDRVCWRPAETAWLDDQGLDWTFHTTSTALAFEAGRPFVVPIHDLQHRLQPHFPEVSAGGEWAWREYLFRNLTRYATLILVDSEVGREDALEYYGPFGLHEDRVKVLPFRPPSYLDPAPGAAARARVRLAFGLPERYLFYPAQFWPHKNHLRLVQALAVLRGRGEEVHVVLCGAHTGAHREQAFARVMEETARSGVSAQVHVLGYVANSDMSALYAEAAGVVMPTFFGPTNIPVIEAWAFGKPVLTSDIRGVREQVGAAGLLVDPASVEALADGVQRLWTDAALGARLVARGHARLAERSPAAFDRSIAAVVAEADERVRAGDAPLSRPASAPLR